MKRRKSHKPSRKTRENAAAFLLAWAADGVLLTLSPTYKARRKNRDCDLTRVEWYALMAQAMGELEDVVDMESITGVKEIQDKIQEVYGANK